MHKARKGKKGETAIVAGGIPPNPYRWVAPEGKERDHRMILECPHCTTNYHVDVSRFAEWSSARVRCRRCGKSFTATFRAAESPEPLRQPGALPVPSGMVATADPPAPVTPVPPPARPRDVDLVPDPQGGPGESSGKGLPDLPGSAGDGTLSIATPEEPSIPPPRAMELPPGGSRNRNSSSWYWSLLAASAIVAAVGIGAAALFRFLAARFIPM